MHRVIQERIRQGYRTIPYPAGDMPKLPERYRGLPVIDSTKCPDGCRECSQACPTEAIVHGETLQIDLGRCLFCTECMDACPEGAIQYTQDFRMAMCTRQGLVTDGRAFELAEAVDEKSRRIFGHSLQLRQVRPEAATVVKRISTFCPRSCSTSEDSESRSSPPRDTPTD